MMLKKSCFVVIRLLLAALFVFSGFVKSVDPAGTIIKINEYFLSFGWNELLPFVSVFAVIICAAELLIGLMLLCNVFNKTVRWAVLLFMAGFTLLTAYIVVENPVSDCGCFGDALKLSNMQTLLKNLFFLGLAIVWFVGKKEYSKVSCGRQIQISLLLLLLSLAIPLYSLGWGAALEFLPYKIGVDIPMAMSTPSDAPQSVYQTTLLYKDKNNGKVREFALEDTTWYDTLRWEYVDTKNKLIEKGYQPPITSFVILNAEGEDDAPKILSDTSLVFLVSVYRCDLTQKEMRKLQMLQYFARNNNLLMVVATHNDLQQCRGAQATHNIDQTLLKSLIRNGSHNGVVVLKEGVVKAKWSLSKTPEITTMEAFTGQILRNQAKEKSFLLLVSLFVLVVVAYRYWYIKKNDQP